MDFYIEFYDKIDELFFEFTNSLCSRKPEWFNIVKSSLQEIVISQLYMYSLSAGWKEKYNKLRLEGVSSHKVKKIFFDELENVFGIEDILFDTRKIEPDIDELEKILMPYKNQIIFYLFNYRQLTILSNVIKEIEEPILILADFNLSDKEAELFCDNITILQIEFFKTHSFSNPYLLQRFPLMFYYLNSFNLFIKYLKPQCVVFLEGCHAQARCLNIVSKEYKIPTICIQQGWPSLLHTLYRRMEYDYYLTWGKAFNKWWKLYNPKPKYKEVGYIHKVESFLENDSLSKKKITFFLQSPVFLSDENYFNKLLCLIETTAKTFPDKVIQVKEHPEYKVSMDFIKRYSNYENIFLVSNKPIDKVFNESLITVSHFSTTSIESMLYNCIPLIFDPTTNSEYYPYIESLGVGYCTKSEEEFINKVQLILDNNKQAKLIKRIGEIKQNLFCDYNESAIDKIIYFIKNVSLKVNTNEISQLPSTRCYEL